MKEKQIEEMAKTMCPNYGEESCRNFCMARNGCFIRNGAEILYNAGYRKQEWISVEESPEVYRGEYGDLIPFLACCKGTVYPFRAVYDGKCWGDGIGKLNVTHWMPLPEPPKEGDK